MASESVVVRKCRRAGYRCYRLFPTTWRALARFEDLVERSPSPRQAWAVVAAELKPRVAPRLDALMALRQFVPLEARRRLIERHTQANWPAAGTGIPDLFVCKDGRGAAEQPFAAFAEVKRPREVVKPNQKDEIAFLRGLGLRAGVFRLVDRQPKGTPARE